MFSFHSPFSTFLYPSPIDYVHFQSVTWSSHTLHLILPSFSIPLSFLWFHSISFMSTKFVIFHCLLLSCSSSPYNLVTVFEFVFLSFAILFLMPSARSSSWFFVLFWLVRVEFWLVEVWYWCSSFFFALIKIGSVSIVFSKKSRLARTQLSRNAAIESPKVHHLTKSAVGYYSWHVFLVVSVNHIPGVPYVRAVSDCCGTQQKWRGSDVRVCLCYYIANEGIDLRRSPLLFRPRNRCYHTASWITESHPS